MKEGETVDKLDMYYDHYKDSNALCQTAQSRRNKSFVVLCVLEAISFMLIRNPDFICGLLNDVAREKLESSIQFSNTILQTLVWILIAYVLIRYVQDVLYVEKEYKYLSTLEKKISELLGEPNNTRDFAREGDHYFENYPLVKNLIHLFYTFFSPILFTVINIIHIVQEWNSSVSCSAVIADTAICVAIFIITWFYFFEIHSKISNWFKKCRPIGWMAGKLRKWLKEV